MPAIYSSLLRALTPLAFARLWWKGRDDPAYRERWSERLGHIPDLPARPRLWVHAVSVGETIAAAPLVRTWRARHPDWAILLTTTTPTGSAQVRRLFGDTVEHVYLPYDLSGAVHRFFEHARPTLGVVMETELWPNLFAEADRQGIPLILANARLSERSMRGYAKAGKLVRSTLGHLRLIAARGPEDAARFITLGADPDRVTPLGNLKFDMDVSSETIERGHTWRAILGQERPVWIAASTHPGEDELVLAAHRHILATQPNALLMLAPRHPERVDDIAQLADEHGFKVHRRSQPLPHDGMIDVFLIDTLGELMDFYAASDLAFMGGSLMPNGGHNPLEPAALGLPVLTGSQVFNFREVYAAMLAADAAQEVTDARALGDSVASLMSDAERRQDMGGKGQNLIASHRGALDRLIEHMEKALREART